MRLCRAHAAAGTCGPAVAEGLWRLHNPATTMLFQQRWRCCPCSLPPAISSHPRSFLVAFASAPLSCTPVSPCEYMLPKLGNFIKNQTSGICFARLRVIQRLCQAPRASFRACPALCSPHQQQQQQRVTCSSSHAQEHATGGQT